MKAVLLTLSFVPFDTSLWMTPIWTTMEFHMRNRPFINGSRNAGGIRLPLDKWKNNNLSPIECLRRWFKNTSISIRIALNFKMNALIFNLQLSCRCPSSIHLALKRLKEIIEKQSKDSDRRLLVKTHLSSSYVKLLQNTNERHTKKTCKVKSSNSK